MKWRQYAFPIAILAIAVVAGIVVLIVNVAGGDDGKSSASSGCKKVAAPAPKQTSRERRPTLVLSRTKSYSASVETNCGTFVIKLDSKRAPKTGGSFVTLARKGFYDGTTFHRIAPGFVIQGGDPTGSGSGGPGYKIVEPPPKDVVYSEGVVAMAKGGSERAGTSGSQFFVVTANDANLPPDYALLGQVTQGLDVVHRIDGQGTADGQPPKQPIVMSKVTISEN
jgi:peptidyl-prolyl cis-trans isomerase B (cyclophilin B)